MCVAASQSHEARAWPQAPPQLSNPEMPSPPPCLLLQDRSLNVSVPCCITTCCLTLPSWGLLSGQLHHASIAQDLLCCLPHPCCQLECCVFHPGLSGLNTGLALLSTLLQLGAHHSGNKGSSTGRCLDVTLRRAILTGWRKHQPASRHRWPQQRRQKP
jgi:hypothetical protein